MGAAAEPGTTRRDALRKAGADYLERAMQQAKLKGSVAQQDPFAPQEPPPTGTPAPAPLAKARSGSTRRRAKLQQPVDPEFAAFGAVFESTKLYIYMGVYLVSQACIYGEPAGHTSTIPVDSVRNANNQQEFWPTRAPVPMCHGAHAGWPRNWIGVEAYRYLWGHACHAC